MLASPYRALQSPSSSASPRLRVNLSVPFGITVTFLLSAPGWEAGLGGFAALSVVPGQFLLKDLVLLAASISLLGNALRQAK